MDLVAVYRTTTQPAPASKPAASVPAEPEPEPPAAAPVAPPAAEAAAPSQGPDTEQNKENGAAGPEPVAGTREGGQDEQDQWRRNSEANRTAALQQSVKSSSSLPRRSAAPSTPSRIS